jgi:hypothetical protein
MPLPWTDEPEETPAQRTQSAHAYARHSYAQCGIGGPPKVYIPRDQAAALQRVSGYDHAPIGRIMSEVEVSPAARALLRKEGKRLLVEANNAGGVAFHLVSAVYCNTPHADLHAGVEPTPAPGAGDPVCAITQG